MEDCSYLSYPNDSVKGSSYPMNQRSMKIQARDKKNISQAAEEQIFPALNNKEEYCATCMEDYSHLSESEDSIKVPSYPLYQGSLKIQHRDLMVSDSFSSGTIPSLNDKQKIDFVEALNLMDDRDLTNGETSLPLSSTEEDMDLVRSRNNFLPARDNHLPRPIIPIGPRFQAKIPKWEGGTDIKLGNDDDGLRWYGTQIWPIPFIFETNI